MGTLCRSGQPVQHVMARLGEFQDLPAPVDRVGVAANETSIFEFLHDETGRRTIEPHQLRQPDLVQIGARPEHPHNPVLARRSAERRDLLTEQRARDLVGAAEHEAGPVV